MIYKTQSFLESISVAAMGRVYENKGIRTGFWKKGKPKEV